MEIVFDRCAGSDVHKRTVVVCRLTRDDAGVRQAQTQTFGTTTSELLCLADGLTEGGCPHVGLESTGECWKPVFNLLEGACAVWLLNAAHIKAVPGRKTDVKDARDGSLNAWRIVWCAPTSSRRAHRGHCVI
jgi:hypothetical protein